METLNIHYADHYIAQSPGTIYQKSGGTDVLTIQSSHHMHSTGFYRESDNQDGKEPTLLNPACKAEGGHKQGNAQIWPNWKNTYMAF